MEAVFTEWRRPGSSCGGGLVLAACDLRAGAGWGLIDALGRPKAPWYALRRVFRPLTLLAVDEGLNGLDLHVVNDQPTPFRGRLAVELVVRGEVAVERAEVAVAVPARGSATFSAEGILGGWRDVSYAYRFSPPAHDAVVATLLEDSGPDDPSEAPDEPLARVVHLPLGQARALESDVGLRAVAQPRADGGFDLIVSTTRLAQWVTVRAPGCIPEDSWFHLPPGAQHTVVVRPEKGPAEATPGTLRGTVGALNAVARAPIVMATA